MSPCRATGIRKPERSITPTPTTPSAPTCRAQRTPRTAPSPTATSATGGRAKTDAKGQTINYLRDTYGRVTQVQHTNPNDPSGNPVPPTVMRTYLYDTN